MMTKKPADALSSSKELVRVFEGIVHQVRHRKTKTTSCVILTRVADRSRSTDSSVTLVLIFVLAGILKYIWVPNLPTLL